ncbi:MAG: hypothetical protein JO134_15235 [Xanthobacteraceae bacterium]|nr:hypothetical protein [Xanthobacteraceae bacterium]
MHKLKTAFIGVVFGAVALASAPACAIRIGDLGAASKSLTIETQKVVWVCGWYRCWWRPVVAYPAPYVYYRPYWAWRPYWGWRRWWW